MKRTITFITALVLAAYASALPSRPEPQRLVNDLAGIFSSAQTSALEHELTAFDDSTSNQIAIITTKDLEGYAHSEYATRIGLEWGVGSERFDNGIVVLVKPKDNTAGQVFIAVGYGLEGAIPDAYAKRIINEIMIPHFKSEDYYAGVYDACQVLMKLASGEISEIRESEEAEGAFAVFIISIIILVLIILIAAKSDNGNSGNHRGNRTVFTGPVIISGNRGWGSTGGGFGGGFGGFGGGSFGGGGAGGSW